MGVPQHLIFLMHNIYSGQEAIVRAEYGEIEWFLISKSVRQGCILFSYLFNLCIEHIIWEANIDSYEKGVRIGERNTSNLRYAADTILLSETSNVLEQLLAKVQLNMMKTKIMTTKELQN